MRLEGWIMIGSSITGYIYNSKLHDDGKCITTSRVVWFDEESLTVRTYSGSEYRLGHCTGQIACEIAQIKRILVEAKPCS